MGRGIITRGDLLTTTVDGVDLNQIWAEFQAQLSLVNEARDAVSRLFTFQTTRKSDAISLDGDTMNFEEHSEFGMPKTGRVQPKQTLVGFPLNWYDLRISYTEDYLRDATAADVQSQHYGALEANNRLLNYSILRALMSRTTLLGGRVANENGASIYSLYDGSTDSVPPSFAGRSFSAGHEHYLVSGGALVDGQDLVDCIRHITHHGFGINTTEKILLLMHPDVAERVRGFRRGVDSSPYDFIPAEGAPAFLSSENVIGDRPPLTFQGLDVIGSYGNALVIESYYVPNGYVTAVSTSGYNSARNALGFRSHPRPEYQGLRIKPGIERYPLVGSTYAQGFGVGVRNRGAAVVMQIKASGTYDSPSFPMF